MPAQANKREAKRISYPVEVRCEAVGIDALKPTNPRISDLSVTGAFVDSQVTLPAGSTVRLRFLVAGAPLELTGEVVHAMPTFGMGICFLDVTTEQHALIERLVRGA